MKKDKIENIEKEILLQEISKLEKSIKDSEISLSKIKEILAVLTKEQKKMTKEELENAVLEVAKMISKSSKYGTIMANKMKLLRGERKPDIELRPLIQAKFGIPQDAWYDMAWYYSTLLPTKKSKKK